MLNKEIIGIKNWEIFLQTHVNEGVGFFYNLEKSYGTSFCQEDLIIIYKSVLIINGSDLIDFFIFLSNKKFDFSQTKYDLKKLKSNKKFKEIIEYVPELLTKEMFEHAKENKEIEINAFIIKKYLNYKMGKCLEND